MFEIDTSDQMVIPTLRLAIHCIGSVVAPGSPSHKQGDGRRFFSLQSPKREAESN